MLKDHINMMLVYIFIIVLLFCIMYVFIYNDKELKFDNTFNNTIKNKTKKVSTFEKFNDNIVISGEAANNYINNLTSLKNEIENIDTNQIQNIIKNINSIKDTKDEKNDYILKQINTIYWKRYLENINQTNASVFNEYLKYSEPKKNKYYQQYL